MFDRNRGAMVLRRDRTGFSDWITISMWEASNMHNDSGRSDFDVRRDFPGDAEFLIGPHPIIDQFELVCRSQDAFATLATRPAVPGTDTEP